MTISLITCCSGVHCNKIFIDCAALDWAIMYSKFIHGCACSVAMHHHGQ